MHTSLGDEPTSELPAEVVERILVELGPRGEKVLAALRTASALLALALHDESGLRFAESATYNVREALEAVVSGQAPGEGVLASVLAAWQLYQDELAGPANDDGASLEALKSALRRAEEKQDRSSYHAARLLRYLRDKAGVDPISGAHDPVAEYDRIRKRASGALHTSITLDVASELHTQTLSWFVRMFTPPDTVVVALRELAAEPWRGGEQIGRLRDTASNVHHVRLFLSELKDPAWLVPLHAAGAVTLPQEGSPWPVRSLLESLVRTSPAEVARLLGLLFVDTTSLTEERKLDAGFHILVIASQLGPEGNVLVGDIAVAHPRSRHVRALAVDAIKRADPADPVVQRVARVVLTGDPSATDRYYYKAVLEQLGAGLTVENFGGRFGMLVAKVGEAAEHERAGWVVIDIARLTTELSEHERHYLVIIVHYLARLIDRAGEFGVSATSLLKRLRKIPGAIGERLVSQVLAHAEDITLEDMVEHVSRRLRSSTATGEDEDLVAAILARMSDVAELEVWREALGTPSERDGVGVPADWARAWRWSAVLPGELLTDWEEQIARVSDEYGPSTPDFGRRIPPFVGSWGQSPYSAEELAALSVAEAESLIAQWRPDSLDSWRLKGARELARALQATVESNPGPWSDDPVRTVRSLREPVYVLHYFNGLTKKAADVSVRTDAIIAATQLARSERWEPTVLGSDNFDYEPDWNGVDTAIVDLIAGLANSDAPLDLHLDLAWEYATAHLDRVAHPRDWVSDSTDVLTQAINNRRGRGLQAVLALAAWEHRNGGTIRGRFQDILDELLQIPGDVGMEFRAVLAERRVLLEAIALEWLDNNVDALFREEPLGEATLEISLRYSSRGTPWFYRALRDDLFAAAHRGADNAVMWVVLAMLHDLEGYDAIAIIKKFRGKIDLLAKAAEESAFIVQDSVADAPQLTAAVGFWRALLDAKPAHVPAAVLHSTGRWAFVDGIAEDDWARLMSETLQVTAGSIDYVTEVADRCKAAPVPTLSAQILLLLLGAGEPWEQHHVGETALEALRTLSLTRQDDNFTILRTRLIELGWHQAADLTPYESRGEG